MGRATDVMTMGAALHFLPVEARMPLKFGRETLTHVICARTRVTVRDQRGRSADGWGETPLSVQWVWPSSCPYEERLGALKQFCIELADLWAAIRTPGHPVELGHGFLETVLPGWLDGFNQRHRRGKEPMPRLAALACCSPFDMAVHDAYGILHERPTYSTYTADFMNRDLAAYLQPANPRISFQGKYPADFLTARRDSMVAWHLVGALDPVDDSDLTGFEPHDGHPVLLADWIRRDGLKCLKVKLRGTDPEWDYQRFVKVAAIGGSMGVDWLSADFNCTLTDPEYVDSILDRLRDEQPRSYGSLLYVEQPFAYELEKSLIDVHGVAARKPLFLDESAHDWRLVRLGRELGWSGVALKTCKTQTGALLMASWARAHGMSLMVQDLTNPMLAQISHLLLAAHTPTLMGVETNSMQYYPGASAPEEAVHSGLYRRRGGCVDLSSIRGSGIGYRLAEISRRIPEAAIMI